MNKSKMKFKVKKLVFFVFLVSLGLLIGCGNNTKNTVKSNSNEKQEVVKENMKINLSGKNTIENVVEFEINYINENIDVKPSNIDNFYTHYENKEPNNTFLYAVIDVKNLKNESEIAEDIMNISYIIDNKEYTVFSTIEESDGSDFNYANITAIDPLATGKIYYLASVPKTEVEKEIMLKIKVGDNISEVSFKLEEVKPKTEIVNLGDTLVSEEYAEITINSVEYLNILNPSNPDGYYNYYEVKDSNNIYLVLDVTVKNLKANSLDADRVMRVEGIYDDKYMYDGFSVIEEDDGSDFSYTNMTNIEPLKTARMYYLIDMPKEVQEGKVELKINMNGKMFSLYK